MSNFFSFHRSSLRSAHYALNLTKDEVIEFFNKFNEERKQLLDEFNEKRKQNGPALPKPYSVEAPYPAILRYAIAHKYEKDYIKLAW